MDAIIRSAHLVSEPRQLRRAAERRINPNPSSSGSEAVQPVAPVAPEKPVLRVNAGLMNTANSAAVQKNQQSSSPATENAGKASLPTQAKPSLFLKPEETKDLPIQPPAKDFASVYEDEKEKQLQAERVAKQKLEQEIAGLKNRSEIELGKLAEEAKKLGFAEGQSKGELAARESLQLQIDRFKSLAMQLAQARSKVLDEAEDAIVEIVFSAICKILGEQAASRANIVKLVRDCVGETRDPSQVNVRLHPDDAALIQENLPGSGEWKIRISPDPAIVIGGCVVDSSTGTLDARLEMQLELLQESLLTVRAQRKNTGEAI